MNEELALIPKPRNYSADGGKLVLKDDFKIWHTDDTALEAERLREFLAEQLGLRLSLLALESDGFEICLSPRKPSVRELTRRLDAEGYTIHVDRKELSLRGGSKIGVFWGGQTLRQMFDQGEKVVASRILDQPALPWRGVHLDFRGAMPTFAALIALLDQMAQHKLNIAILEYQDGFPYSRHSAIKKAGALTPSQLQRILDFAGDRHLEVIPLVQSLGNAEYVLRHPEYRSLGENGSIRELCPSNPGTLELVKNLIDEVLALHPECRFLHLGGEDAMHLGTCQECSRKARRKGRLVPFIHYMGELCRYLLERGIRPMLWTDMFWRRMDPFAVRGLPKEVILVDRNFASQEIRSPFVWWGPEGLRLSRQAVEEGALTPRSPGIWFDGLSEAELGFLEKYWKPDAAWKEGESFPLLRFFLDEGFEVLGAGAASGAGETGLLTPDYVSRFKNLSAWSKTADREGILGMIASSRSREQLQAPPLEPFISLAYSIPAAGDFFWCGERSDVEDFQRRFALSQYNDDEERIPRAVNIMSRTSSRYEPIQVSLAHELLTDIREGATRGKKFLDYLILGCELKRWHSEIDHLLETAEARLYLAERGKIMPEEIKARIEKIREKLKEANGLRRRVRNVLKGQAQPEDIREITEGQIFGRELRAKTVLDQLNKYK